MTLLKSLLRLVLLCLLGLGAVWAYGRTQQAQVLTTERTESNAITCAACGGSGRLKCAVCGGYGGHYIEKTCPTCKGSGKGEWKLGPKTGGMGSQPMCMTCKGTGKVRVKETCKTCQGTGFVPCTVCGGSGKQHQARTIVEHVVRLEPSLWARVLQLVGVAPEANPAPRVLADGSVPAVLAYLSIMLPPNVTFDVVEWAPVERDGDAWVVKARMNVETLTQEREAAFAFRIANRLVEKSEKITWD